MIKSKRLRKIKISFKALEAMLLGTMCPCTVAGLPREFEILRVSDANQLGTGIFEVVIRSDEFSEIADNQLIPLINPEYTEKCKFKLI